MIVQCFPAVQAAAPLPIITTIGHSCLVPCERLLGRQSRSGNDMENSESPEQWTGEAQTKSDQLSFYINEAKGRLNANLGRGRESQHPL